MFEFLGIGPSDDSEAIIRMLKSYLNDEVETISLSQKIVSSFPNSYFCSKV